MYTSTFSLQSTSLRLFHCQCQQDVVAQRARSSRQSESIGSRRSACLWRRTAPTSSSAGATTTNQQCKHGHTGDLPHVPSPGCGKPAKNGAPRRRYVWQVSGVAMFPLLICGGGGGSTTTHQHHRHSYTGDLPNVP